MKKSAKRDERKTMQFCVISIVYPSDMNEILGAEFLLLSFSSVSVEAQSNRTKTVLCELRHGLNERTTPREEKEIESEREKRREETKLSHDIGRSKLYGVHISYNMQKLLSFHEANVLSFLLCNFYKRRRFLLF